MKLAQFYKKVLQFGSQRDPRKTKGVRTYPDTAILYAGAPVEIKTIMAGIDIEVGELLLADKIRKEKKLDLVISHHPEGRALVALHKVMQLQVDVLVKAGLAREVAREFLEERIREVERKLMPNNYMRSVDVARLLDIPFICVHTPADNHAAWFIKTLLEREKPRNVAAIIDILKKLPEYREAEKELNGPRIILGNPKREVGKILVEMTGGTEGSKDVFDKLYKVGVRTIVAMHLSEEHFKKVRDANLNVVIAGHISSDTLGLNLLLDRIEKDAGEPFNVISCSGFRRFPRSTR